MGKEAKIGVAVIGTLLMVFCGVLYQRVSKLKTTPPSVAKSEPKPDAKSGLFGAPNKLAAVADDATAPSASKSPFKSNSQPPDAPVASTVTAEDTAAVGDRYGSRFSQPAEPTGEPEAAVAEDAAATDAIVSQEPAEAPAPVAVSNPFARSTPAAETAEPASAEPTEPIAIVSEQPTPPAAENSIPDEVVSDESAAPARLVDDAVSTAAVAEPASSNDVSQRPTGRFVTPQDESPAETPNYGGLKPRIAAEPSTIAGGKYKLGPNENFWTVSERAYGSGGYFKALHAYNAEKHPVADELTVGDEVLVPLKSELERQFPDLCPKPGRRPAKESYAMQASARMPADGSTYVVQEGDTLFDIARYELGKASRWAELYELNRDVIGDDIDFLRAGMELVLPDEAGKADAVTRQPGEAVQR